ncbi:MAG: carboxypeptidase-like regulatory domain-containing protein [Bryobacteraceae bacterium]
MRASFAIVALLSLGPAHAAGVKGTRIEGRVIDSITSEPVRKATVSLTRTATRGGPNGGNNSNFDAVTDASGAFKIEGVPDGQFRIGADRTGFVRGSGMSTLRLAARSDNDSQSITIKLTPQGVISGRVLDEDGDPMEHVLVQAFRQRISGGNRRILPMNAVSTNDLGEFRLAGMAPGRYWLGARRDRGGPSGPRRPGQQKSTPERNYIPLFYPDAESPARASEIPIAAGQQVQGVEMRMRKASTYHVLGRVQGITQEEASERFRGPGAMVFLTPEGDAGFFPDRRPFPVNPKDGSFDVSGVLPGRYTLTANQMRRDRRRTAKTHVDVSEADVAGIDLTLQESPVIKGRVVMEGDGERTEMSVSLEEYAGGGMFGGAFGRVSKDDGTFTMSPTDPGHYRVTAGGLPQGYYLKSIHFGEQEVKPSGFDISTGGIELKLTIAPGAPVVRGTVKDAKGDPAADVTVSVAPQDSLAAVWDLYRIAKTDQQGSFEFTLPPGAFKFYAWEQIESDGHQDTVLLEKYASKAASEKLAAGDQKTIELKLISVQ